jgi:hypothetical protein
VFCLFFGRTQTEMAFKNRILRKIIGLKWDKATGKARKN